MVYSMSDSKYDVVKFKNEKFELDVNVDPNENTIWLSLEQISNLFDRDKSVISRHIKNTLQTRELKVDSCVAFFAHTINVGNV